jgi:tetratricopeptide (TPR) repeat protein
MQTFRTWFLVLAVALAASASATEVLTREQALMAIEDEEVDTRLAGVVRLVEIGAMDDADRLLSKLADDDSQVRVLATAALWQIWSRSGDPDIDKLFARGMEQLKATELDDALATFDEVVQRRPAFAEGWHKRALVHFLMDKYDKALLDCDEALKRNRNHFGALSGAGQIHLQMGHAKRALEFFRRAVQVNPNLHEPARMIPMLEEYLRQQYQSMI